MHRLGTHIAKLLKINDIGLNRNIITYLVCVIIASVLWFLNTLNKDYSAEISYPVKYINFPQNKYPVEELPAQLELSVRAKGFALLAHRVRTSFLPITFNVSSYTNHLLEKNNTLEYTLNTNDIKDKISGQLSADIKLQSISPEEIVFKFALAKSKKVAIRPIVHYTLKRQYILNRITATPDSIIVSGPAPFIDTLQYISTSPLKLKEVGKNITKTVDLMQTEQYSFEDIPVEINIQVEQFTEARKTIQITPLNVPDSINIRLFPNSVNISYEVGLSKYDKVSANDFVFSVNYPRSTDTSYLEIKVEKAPAFIKDLMYSPQKVEYILERK